LVVAEMTLRRYEPRFRILLADDTEGRKEYVADGPSTGFLIIINV
jgi:hypothetical protein